ncbi:hypothetical protein HN51_050497 [Arachis hypogaea]
MAKDGLYLTVQQPYDTCRVVSVSNECMKRRSNLKVIVKEKIIAARRSEVKTIVFPSANRRDFDELAPNIKEGLHVHFVDDFMQIFDLAFDDDNSQHSEKYVSL